MTDAELADRSITGFAEILALLGRTGVDGAREVRGPGLVGARVPWALDNHWIDAAVATGDVVVDDPPHCLWSATGDGKLATPCMGLELAGFEADAEPLEAPPHAVVGDFNDRAYGQQHRLAPLLTAIDDPAVRSHGLRVDGAWACVMLSVRSDDDLGVQYVATDAAFRRRGLATRLVSAVLAQARDAGLRTATLTASPDGLPVYERMGFRTVATLHATFA